MSRQRRRGRDQHPRPVPPSEQAEACLGQRGAHRPVPARGALPPLPAQPWDARDHQRARHGAPGQDTRSRGEAPGGVAGEAARLRQRRGGPRDQECDAGRRQHHLTRDPFEQHHADATAHVAAAPAVHHRPVHVAEDPAGQCRVQEQGPVVGGHGASQRQPEVHPPGHQAPAPCAAHGGEQADAQCGQQGGPVDAAQTLQHGSGALPPQRRPEHGRAAEHPQAPADRSPDHAAPPVHRGSASTSLWCTTTSNPPAAHCARRRRR